MRAQDESDVPALLDLCPQEGDGVFVILFLVLCGVEFLLEFGTLVHHVGQGVREILLPGLYLRKGVGELVPMTGGFCQGRPKVGDDVGKDLWVE